MHVRALCKIVPTVLITALVVPTFVARMISKKRIHSIETLSQTSESDRIHLHSERQHRHHRRVVARHRHQRYIHRKNRGQCSVWCSEVCWRFPVGRTRGNPRQHLFQRRIYQQGKSRNRRCCWLGLPVQSMCRRELGPRRRRQIGWEIRSCSLRRIFVWIVVLPGGRWQRRRFCFVVVWKKKRVSSGLREFWRTHVIAITVAVTCFFGRRPPSKYGLGAKKGC